MKMTMIPGSCANEYTGTAGSFCESCFAHFLVRRGEPDLACITAVEDDQSEEKTLIMQYGSYQQTVLLTDEERERLAYGGWQGWTHFVEELPESASGQS